MVFFQSHRDTISSSEQLSKVSKRRVAHEARHVIEPHRTRDYDEAFDAVTAKWNRRVWK